MDAATEKLIGVSAMFLVSLASVGVNSWATYVVGSNPKLSQTVRLFFVTEHVLRVSVCLITVLFTTPCAFTYFCAQTESFTVGWFTNRVIGTIMGSMFFTLNLFAFAISANRFFAVFLDGRYYGLVTKGAWMQLFFLLLVPLLVLSPCMLEGQAYHFEPITYGWWSDGDIAEFVTGDIVANTDVCVWVLVIFLDSFTAFTIRRKMIKSGKTSVSRMDVNIIKQVVFSHMTTLVYLGILRVLELQKMWEQLGDLEVLLIYDFMGAVLDLMAGIARLYFVRLPEKTKITPPTDAFARKLSTSSVMKTGTSGTTEIIQN